MDNTKSIWEGTSDNKMNFTPYSGNSEADVVIIGGGITGITAALLLSNAGKKVTLLEACEIGLGTTGNSTGNLYVTVDEHLSTLKSKWNSTTMKTVVESRRAAIDFIEQQVNMYQIDCEFIRTNFNHYAEGSDEKSRSFFKEELEAMKECGIEAHLKKTTSLPFEIDTVLTVEGQAQFNPLKYVRKLASIASARCTIHENSAVTEYDEKTGIVKTAMGSITAKVIVMATHTPKGVFLVHTVLGPYREFGIAAELKDNAVEDGIFWSVEKPKHSIRTYSVDGKNYIMVIGDKFKTGQHQDSAAYLNGLEEYLRRRFNIGDIIYKWGGQQYTPADGLPYMGKNSEKLYLMTGFATDGLVYGTLGAMIVSDQIIGRKNEWEHIYDPTRHTPIKSAKDFIKENANNAMQYKDLLPGKVDTDSLVDILPGEGKVMEMEGKKVAVYRDENHNCHIVSAICPHLMCVVNWNGSEKSWDCPCHGSRFKTDGTVIEGPATSNLEKKIL